MYRLISISFPGKDQHSRNNYMYGWTFNINSKLSFRSPFNFNLEIKSVTQYLIFKLNFSI